MQTINKMNFLAGICLGLVCVLTTGQLYARTDNAGIILADEKGHILFEKNANDFFVPASTLKILTSLAALHYLKSDYRFPTRYFYDPSSGDFHIKGLGDPLFISEQIRTFSRQVSGDLKHQQIQNICVDQSFFCVSEKVPGQGQSLNPYDAPLNALSANFNTIFFNWDAGLSRYVSAEPQTPLLPFFAEKLKTVKIRQGRIPLSKRESETYAGELVKYFLESEGVAVLGQVTLQCNWPAQKPGQQFISGFNLNDVLRYLLQYSNNFIANQLTLALGAHLFGEPGNMEKGVRVLKQYALEQLHIKKIKLFEGSGISRSNRISPIEMLKVLEQFKPNVNLLNHDAFGFYKTGTLNGIRTRAGYLVVSENRYYPYVIMMNGKNMKYTGLLKKMMKIADTHKKKSEQ